MVLPIVLALLSAIILFALIRPLLNPPVTEPDRNDVSVTLFRDQLAEIARDRDAGLLAASDAAAARLELERRLIAATAMPAPAAGSRQNAWIPVVSVAAMLVLIPVPLYLYLGTPDLPDLPFALRTQERALIGKDGNFDLDKARIALEEKLKQTPDSPEGWMFLGRTDVALGRNAEANAAYEKALSLSRRRPDILEAYGEALVGEGQGVISPAAQALFEEAVKASPGTAYNARYALALARAQDGDLDGAIADWRKLADDAPADATWLPTVRAAIAAAERSKSGGATPATPSPPPGEVAAIAKLPAGERLDAIKGMVAGLAAKLAQNPGDLDGWKRLGRSYLVLGETAKSADAYGKAVALAPQDADLALSYAQATRGDDDILSDRSIDAYGKVNALSPDQPEALFYLGLAAKQHGDIAGARAHWTRLLGVLKPDSEQAKQVSQQLNLLPT